VAALINKATPATVAKASDWTTGVQHSIEQFSPSWQATWLGAEWSKTFHSHALNDGAKAARADEGELGQYPYLHALSRRLFFAPFRNVGLVSPVTTSAYGAKHTALVWEAVESLAG
jgi:glutamate-1-semialdehyde aminotransferase